MRLIFLHILVWSIGSITLGVCIYTAVMEVGPSGQDWLLVKHSDPFIRYSGQIAIGYLSLLLMAYPVLVSRGVFLLDLNDTKDKRNRAKTFFYSALFSLPGWLYLAFGLYQANGRIPETGVFVITITMGYALYYGYLYFTLGQETS